MRMPYSSIPAAAVSYVRSLPRTKQSVVGCENIWACLHRGKRMEPLPIDLLRELDDHMTAVYHDHPDVKSISVDMFGEQANALEFGQNCITSDASRSTRCAFIVAHFPRLGGPLLANNSWLRPGRVSTFVTIAVTLYKRDGTSSIVDHTLARVTWCHTQHASELEHPGYDSTRQHASAVGSCGYTSAWYLDEVKDGKRVPWVNTSWLPIGRIASSMMPVYTKIGTDRVMYTCWLPPHI